MKSKTTKYFRNKKNINLQEFIDDNEENEENEEIEEKDDGSDTN